ncbi:MAG TPA: hypothetical protein VJ743_00895 [Albitalea sp.]|nr:hypothetical protein [Albitalea sp.]
MAGASIDRSRSLFRFDTLAHITHSTRACRMTAITIQETLLDCGGEARVVLANDESERPLVGLTMDAGTKARVFVQIDRVTMLELERGIVDLPTVLADRCAGIALGA